MQDLFDDESPKPNKHKTKSKSGLTQQTSVYDGDKKTGNNKKNKKKALELKTGIIAEVQQCLVAENHKFKYKTESIEEETDVESLVAGVYSGDIHLETAKTIKEEDDDGDTEYKLKLIDTSRERIQQLTSQMKFRVKEGNGEAFYKIGYEDNGNPLGLESSDFKQSLNSLCHISSELRLELVVLKVLRGKTGLVAEIAIREIREFVKTDIKLILMGESGSGKSSIVF